MAEKISKSACYTRTKRLLAGEKKNVEISDFKSDTKLREKPFRFTTAGIKNLKDRIEERFRDVEVKVNRSDLGNCQVVGDVRDEIWKKVPAHRRSES